MKNKLKTRFAALICVAALLVMTVPAVAAAAPVISVGSTTVTQGGTCTVTVAGGQLSALTSLKLTLAYDADAFTVTETAVRSMDVATADKSTAGFIEYIGISMDGISGNQELLNITFRAAANAPAGQYPVTLFCGGATADQSGSDKNISVSVAAGTLTVAESGQVYFDLYSDKTSIESGDQVTLTVSSWTLNKLAGGKFTFLYDSNFFAYQSLDLLSAMTGSTHVYTVNDANEGRIALSFASEEAVRTGELIRITLKAKENVSGTAQITLETAELVNVDAAPMTASSASTSVTITEKARVWLKLPEDMNTHETFTVGFWAEGSSGLAAGDFSVSYDAKTLECLGVTGASISNSYVVVDDGWDDGCIDFSVLVPQGISADTRFLTMEFRARNNASTDITLTPVTTTTPVNRWGDALMLECSAASGTVEVPDHLCVNGYCTVCEQDMITVVWEGNTVNVSVPGLPEDGSAVVAFYDEYGKMLGCCLVMEADDGLGQCVVSQVEKVVKTSVFVMDRQWISQRGEIEL